MDNHEITVIQINKNLQLHLGYIGGTGGTSEPQTDPIFTANSGVFALKSELFNKDYNELINKPEIPTKTSDLINDSSFITTNDIPDETDPIYIADKPNIALKSELFSKSYNDLTDKPDLYTPKTDGDGSQFLADDGTYKTVQTDFEVDLSNYVTQGNINFTTTDANGNLTNKFSQQAAYTQIGCYKTSVIDLYGNYLKWYQQNNQIYPFYGVDFSSATEFKLPTNTTINGQQITANGGGAGGTIDLSNYQTTGNINLISNDSNGNRINIVSLQGDYSQYGNQKTKYIDFYAQYIKFWTPDAGFHYTGVDFSNVDNVKLPANTTIGGVAIETPNFVNLPMKYDLQNDYGYFQADFSLNYVVQKYLNTYAISDGVLTFNINEGTATENQCPTVEVMIPYTADITTFVFQDTIQQIQIPEIITYNPEYTYNYAVFVARGIHGNFYINYSYSFGENE